MTDEKIAELRDAIRRLNSKTLPLKPVGVSEISLLLDERATLAMHLEKLTSLLEMSNWCQECGAGNDPDVADARAALEGTRR